MKKSDSLQVIRTFAFLGIFASHSGITMFSAGGAWGVSVFFILSGFLMIYSYYDTDRINGNGIVYSVKFGINKVKRLYPLHVITLLLAMPYLIVSYIGGRIPNPTIKIIANALLVQSWFPSRGIYFSLNAVSWYLSTSLFLYSMFPFILHQMRKYKGIYTAVFIIAVTFAIQSGMAFISYLVQINIIRDDDFIHWFAYIFPLSRLEDFVIGCNLGYIFINIQRNNKISEKTYTGLELGIIAIIAIQLAVYVHFITIPAKTNPSVSAECWWNLTVMWTLSSCALIYLFAMNKGKISRMLTSNTILLIGNLSANAFLIHQMVYRYLSAFEHKLFGNSFNWVNLFACFFITIISSYLWNMIWCRKR